MSDTRKAPDIAAKRDDVGYKRPPREHQFKKGQKPPPRKKKDPFRAQSMSGAFRKVLTEDRRVVMGDKVRWVTSAELVMMRAWQEAEKGSATLRRELIRLLLSTEAPDADLSPLVTTDPSAPASATDFRLMGIDEAKS